MTKRLLIGVNGLAEKVTNVFVGVNGTARKVKRILVGDANNVARLVYEVSSGELVHIPTMTSNSAPSGTASRSSLYNNNASYEAWHAFDKDKSTRWESRNYSSDNDRWVKYDFGYSITPTKVEIKNYVSQNAWRFVIEASKDDSTWDIIVDARSNTRVIDWTGENAVDVTTTEKYRYFRYRCTSPDNTYRAGVWEFDVWGIKE